MERNMKASHPSVSFLKRPGEKQTEQTRSGPIVEFRAELGLEPSPLTPSGVLVSATPAASSLALLGRPGVSLDRRPLCMADSAVPVLATTHQTLLWPVSKRMSLLRAKMMEQHLKVQGDTGRNNRPSPCIFFWNRLFFPTKCNVLGVLIGCRMYQ